MQTLKVPKTLVKGEDFVVIKRKDYDSLAEYFRWQKELDRDIQLGLADIRAGRVEGPFEPKEAIEFLKRRRNK